MVSVVGCSDGEREGFIDIARFPTIAACSATWNGSLGLRDPRTGGACGDELGPCLAPVDACAPGWHVCADNGQLTDITSRVSAADCGDAGGTPVGEFVAAAQHCESCAGSCTTGESACTYATIYGCTPSSATCNEPMCCGTDCYTSQNCKGGGYPAPDTKVGAPNQPCGALPGDSQTGVLCCAD